MSTQPRNLLTPEEYLEIERKADFKSEYYRGEMFAMSGATREHNILVGNTFRELSLQLRHGPCEIYSNDMRVRVSPPGLYTYPDIVVACVDRHYLDPRRDTLLNRNSSWRCFRHQRRLMTAAGGSVITARSNRSVNTC